MKNNISITAVAIAMCLLTACGSKTAKPHASAAVQVSVAPVQLTEVVYYDEYPGTVTALSQVDVTPQVSGYVTGIHFRDGQHVEKGQLLYTLDQQQYQANVLQADANYKVAEANLQAAQQDADRYLFLQENDAIARQVVDHSVAGLQAAKMQLAAAKAAIQNVQTALKYSTIYAPFSGTIGISLVKPGAAVSPGVTMLNTISSDDPIAVDFNVDEKEITRFLELAQKPASQTDSTFTIVLPNGQLYPFTGNITLLDRAVDPLTGTIKTRLSFTNPKGGLRSGMNCTVRVQNNGTRQQLLVPHKAITEQLGEYFVFVVNADTVRQQKVKTGRVIGDDIIINDGVKKDDMVVTDGTAKLRAGIAVSVIKGN